MSETSQIPKSIPIERGCGVRVAGGTYFECGLSAGGRPIEDFLLDAPVPVPDDLIIPHRGCKDWDRRDKQGNVTTHIADRVGEQYYPNVADFIEEVRYAGLSRRVQSNFPFEKLTRDSRILIVHDRGHIENAVEYLGHGPVEDSWKCPKNFDHHSPVYVTRELEDPRPLDEHFFTMCAGIWWQDLENGRELTKWDIPFLKAHKHLKPTDPRVIARDMPSGERTTVFTYYGRTRPTGVKPIYAPAFIASFPVTRLVVIRGEGADEALKQAQRSTVIPVEEEDE